MDYLKDLSIKFGGRTIKQVILDANNGRAERRLEIKNYKGFKVVVIDYENILKIEVKVECDFSFSINNPDKICVYKTPFSVKNFPYKLYFSNKVNDPFQTEGFQEFWDIFSLNILNLNLYENESIFIYGNAICFALRVNRNISSDMDFIIDLVSDNKIFKKEIGKRKIIVENIPEGLKPLIPLLKKWSLSDDSEREQLVEKTTKGKRKSSLTQSSLISLI
ncbi:MAG: hypothetical protein ACXVI9_09880 [Mucilaginibacter sp.]